MRRSLLFAYEALFLIRLIPCRGDLRKPTYFLEDQGMASWITGKILAQPFDIIRGLYSNLRQEFHYRPELDGQITQFRTKHDVEIPLVFSSKTQKIVFIGTMDSELRPKTVSSALAFLKKNPGYKCVIASATQEPVCKTPELFVIPFHSLI